MMALGKHIRIHFQFLGQDFSWWDLEDCGDGYAYRVVDCGPFQAWFWTGVLVARDTIKRGVCPLITRDQVTASHLKYQITRVEKQREAA